MTLTQDKHLHTGIVGSLLIHGVLLLLLILGFGANAGKWLPRAQPAPKVEKEVVMIFPMQVVPPPVVKPKPEPKAYIRTTQNEAAAKAPSKSGFISDRNTVAASRMAAAPDATLAMPTTKGLAKPMNELANRDFRDGEVKDDALPKALPVPKMLTPQPPTPVPPAPSPPAQVAKAEPAAAPLAKMIEEMDREAVRMKVDRLPLEVRKPGEPPKAAPAKPVTPAPPQVVKAIPIPDSRTAGPNADKDAMSPFTRTSAIKGTITNVGDDAVDAERTAMGVYTRGVTGAVEKKWHVYRRLNKDAVSYGSLKIQFFVTKEGKAEDLKIISDPRDADPRMADFTLRAILDAEIPPIPADLLPMLADERVKIEYDVLIY